MLERRGVSRMEMAVLILLITVFMLVMLPAAMRKHRFGDGHPRPTCQHIMRQLGLVCLMYSNESKGGLCPPLQRCGGENCDLDLPFPDNMTISLPSIWPEYLTDPEILFCPSRSDEIQSRYRAYRDRQYQKDSPPPAICMLAPTSYMYYAWTIPQDIFTLAPALGMERGSSDEAFRTTFATALEKRARLLSTTCLDKESKAYDSDMLVGESVIPRLRRSGGERGSPEDRKTVVMQDRPLQGATSASLLKFPMHSEHWGANVLFLDGHVEFRQYPGVWPLCESWQNLLRTVADAAAK